MSAIDNNNGGGAELGPLANGTRGASGTRRWRKEITRHHHHHHHHHHHLHHVSVQWPSINPLITQDGGRCFLANNRWKKFRRPPMSCSPSVDAKSRRKLKTQGRWPARRHFRTHASGGVRHCQEGAQPQRELSTTAKSMRWRSTGTTPTQCKSHVLRSAAPLFAKSSEKPSATASAVQHLQSHHWRRLLH